MIKKLILKKYSVINNLKELVAMSDIITLHVDYNSSSHRMMDASIFNNFKKGSIFINTSRGEIIDNNALLNSLKKGKIMGAALDVIDNEHSINSHELIEYSKNNDNLIITPHVGGNTIESFKKTEMFVAKKLISSIEKYKNILGIIPARAGSKRVKNKNTKPFADTTLLDIAIKQGLSSSLIDNLVVTSDSKRAAEISKNYFKSGLSFIDRPKNLADDNASALEYINHTINFYEKINKFFEIIVILQPTSPFRTSKDINATIELLLKNYDDADSSVSIAKVPHVIHPHKIKVLKQNYLKGWLVEEGQKTAEHEIPKLYVRNCAVYVFKTSNLKLGISYGKKCLGYEMGEDSLVDINTNSEFDFALHMYKKIKT